MLWAVVVFFGSAVVFGAISNATEDESAALRLGLQALAGLVIVGGLVLYVRKNRK